MDAIHRVRAMIVIFRVLCHSGTGTMNRVPTNSLVYSEFCNTLPTLFNHLGNVALPRHCFDKFRCILASNRQCHPVVEGHFLLVEARDFRF